MSDVTHLLAQIDQGEPTAGEQLLLLVYEELRKLAAAKLAQEKPGQTLQATALVHEAYMRLVDGERRRSSPSEGDGSSPSEGEGSSSPGHWNSRGHFFAAAAEAMRRILVEQARRKSADKRGGQADRQELAESRIVASRSDEDVLAIHDVLDQLSTADPMAANLVRLRFFAGLNMHECADALGLSVRSAHDVWAYARSWLHHRLRPE